MHRTTAPTGMITLVSLSCASASSFLVSHRSFAPSLRGRANPWSSINSRIISNLSSSRETLDAIESTPTRRSRAPRRPSSGAQTPFGIGKTTSRSNVHERAVVSETYDHHAVVPPRARARVDANRRRRAREKRRARWIVRDRPHGAACVVVDASSARARVRDRAPRLSPIARRTFCASTSLSDIARARR